MKMKDENEKLESQFREPRPSSACISVLSDPRCIQETFVGGGGESSHMDESSTNCFQFKF